MFCAPFFTHTHTYYVYIASTFDATRDSYNRTTGARSLPIYINIYKYYIDNPTTAADGNESPGPDVARSSVKVNSRAVRPVGRRFLFDDVFLLHRAPRFIIIVRCWPRVLLIRHKFQLNVQQISYVYTLFVHTL